MEWSVLKCTLLSHPISDTPLQFDNQELRCRPENEYLGVLLTPTGITDTTTLTLIQRTRVRLLQFTQVGLNSRVFP